MMEKGIRKEKMKDEINNFEMVTLLKYIEYIK